MKFKLYTNGIYVVKGYLSKRRLYGVVIQLPTHAPYSKYKFVRIPMFAVVKHWYEIDRNIYRITYNGKFNMLPIIYKKVGDVWMVYEKMDMDKYFNNITLTYFNFNR